MKLLVEENGKEVAAPLPQALRYWSHLTPVPQGLYFFTLAYYSTF